MSRFRPLALLLAFAPLAACGPDGEVMANATVHACELRRIEGELRAHPDDAALQAELRDRTGLLETVIESSGDPEGVRERLADVTCD